MIFRFANPEFLWLLLLLPLLAIWRGKAGVRASVKFPAVALARQVSALVRSRPGRFLFNLRLIIFTLLIVGVARPQTGTETSEIEASGIDIVLAVDLSGSMWAHDFEIGGVRQDRLTVVKSVISDFIEKRPNDRIGLVAFATSPYLVSPLTLNHEWLQQRVSDLQIGLIPEDRTAIGSAIGTSVNRLRDLESKSKVIILLTDGASNSGRLEPLPAAEAAAAFNIRIYSIGVGRDGVVPVPVLNRDGSLRRNSLGQLLLRNQISSIDLETLRKIAERTDGRYFHATATQELQEIYDVIDQLEKTEVTYAFERLYSDVFWIPVASALGLLLLDILLRQTRFRRLP